MRSNRKHALNRLRDLVLTGTCPGSEEAGYADIEAAHSLLEWDTKLRKKDKHYRRAEQKKDES